MNKTITTAVARLRVPPLQGAMYDGRFSLQAEDEGSPIQA